MAVEFVEPRPSGTAEIEGQVDVGRSLGPHVDRGLAATTSYDAIGRPVEVVKSAMAVAGSGVTAETLDTTYGYDPDNGKPTTTTAGGKGITTGYDTWGRPNAYTDALGTASSTGYNARGDVATFNDGTATSTYSYDDHGELQSVRMVRPIGGFLISGSAAGP